MNNLEILYTGDADNGLVVSINGLEVGTIERLGPARRVQLNAHVAETVLTGNEFIFLVADSHSVESMDLFFGETLEQLQSQIEDSALDIYGWVQKFQDSMS